MVILILEAEPEYAAVAAHLVGQVPGLTSRVATSLESLGLALREDAPAAILADLDLLQGLRGVEAVRAMSTSPLVVLGETDRAPSLMEAGADYVLPKPYPPALLTATLRAVLRRRQVERRSAGRVVEVGPLIVEPARRSARIEGRRHLLSPREADLLEYLALNAGTVLSRRQIIEGAWGGDARATPAAVTMCVHRLRRKLEPDPEHPRLLRSSRGGGYLLQPL
ncbi:MAG: response regulator transcription factor, partial [Candidatus Dormibacteria bacterium]